MKQRVGIVCKCQALGSWIIIAQRDTGYYTLPLSQNSIEPYVSLHDGVLKHEYEGKRIPFKLNLHSTGIDADILIPVQPKRKLRKLHF